MVNNVKNKRKKKGFTLIELIIVIAIIAILAAIAIPKFGDVRKNAALKSDIANAKVIANATSALIADGKIPVKLETNIKIDKAVTTGTGKTIGDYLQKIPEPETSEYTDYEVDITADGNVTVSMVGGTGVTEKELYPNIPE